MARPPRLCLLTETFYPAVVGGLEIQAYQMAERLHARGQELFVLTRHINPGSAAHDHVGSIEVFRIPPRGVLKGLGWRALGPVLAMEGRVLYWLVRHANRYDLIMVHGIKVLSIPTVLLSMIRFKTCIIKIDSPYELTEEISTESLRKMRISRSSLPLRAWRAARRLLLQQADCFVAISPEIRDGLIAHGVSARRIHSIPNGIDTTDFRPASPGERTDRRRALSLPEHQTILMFVGRLCTSKGVMMLARVWEELVRSHDAIHLVLVGSGEHSFDGCEAELRGYLDTHGVDQRVSLPGAVTNVSDYLRAADLFVFPSEYEGFGLALVEAMACALPVVTTRVGIAADVIEDRRTGMLVDIGDAAGFRNAIAWLLDHRDEWRAMGNRARHTVETRYGMDAVAERYLELFAELHGAGRGRQRVPE
jgi:glycosyltransferase involved in cell wall biosynthesis